MMALAATSVFVGALLGLRFNVFILVPVVGFAFIFIAVTGISGGASMGWAAVAMVIFANCAQLGYIAAIFSQLVIGDARGNGGWQ
jgi:hypothetical protein